MTFGDGIDWNAEARRAVKDGVPGPSPGGLVSRVAEHIRCSSLAGYRVVDCGCNIARFYSQTKEARLTYIGVDQAPYALAIAKQRYPGIELYQMMLWDDWPTKIGPVEGAFCNAVLQHNTMPEKKKILVRIAQAVKPGGAFAMQESTVPVETKTQLRQGDWVALVEGFGFKLTELWHPNDEYGIFDGYLFVRVSR